MGAKSLAQRIDRPEIEARELLRKHHETYPVFWRWSDAAKDFANLHGKISTVFGWEIHVGSDSNPRSVLNFPMQANGAEMLRLACCLATERGVRVCAPIHDALLIEAPLEELDDAISVTEKAMVEASAAVLGGFELRTDRKIIRYPDRYRDRRGQEMWKTVMKILEELG
jgi:DNA polymerase I-like protein with 3'-5' exonuclease and polymerase domains